MLAPAAPDHRMSITDFLMQFPQHMAGTSSQQKEPESPTVAEQHGHKEVRTQEQEDPREVAAAGPGRTFLGPVIGRVVERGDAAADPQKIERMTRSDSAARVRRGMNSAFRMVYADDDTPPQSEESEPPEERVAQQPVERKRRPRKKQVSAAEELPSMEDHILDLEQQMDALSEASHLSHQQSICSDSFSTGGDDDTRSISDHGGSMRRGRKRAGTRDRGGQKRTRARGDTKSKSPAATGRARSGTRRGRSGTVRGKGPSPPLKSGGGAGGGGFLTPQLVLTSADTDGDGPGSPLEAPDAPDDDEEDEDDQQLSPTAQGDRRRLSRLLTLPGVMMARNRVKHLRKVTGDDATAGTVETIQKSFQLASTLASTPAAPADEDDAPDPDELSQEMKAALEKFKGREQVMYNMLSGMRDRRNLQDSRLKEISNRSARTIGGLEGELRELKERYEQDMEDYRDTIEILKFQLVVAQREASSMVQAGAMDPDQVAQLKDSMNQAHEIKMTELKQQHRRVVLALKLRVTAMTQQYEQTASDLQMLIATGMGASSTPDGKMREALSRKVMALEAKLAEKETEIGRLQGTVEAQRKVKPKKGEKKPSELIAEVKNAAGMEQQLSKLSKELKTATENLERMRERAGAAEIGLEQARRELEDKTMKLEHANDMWYKLQDEVDDLKEQQSQSAAAQKFAGALSKGRQRGASGIGSRRKSNVLTRQKSVQLDAGDGRQGTTDFGSMDGSIRLTPRDRRPSQVSPTPSPAPSPPPPAVIASPPSPVPPPPAPSPSPPRSARSAPSPTPKPAAPPPVPKATKGTQTVKSGTQFQDGIELKLREMDTALASVGGSDSYKSQFDPTSQPGGLSDERLKKVIREVAAGVNHLVQLYIKSRDRSQRDRDNLASLRLQMESMQAGLSAPKGRTPTSPRSDAALVPPGAPAPEQSPSYADGPVAAAAAPVSPVASPKRQFQEVRKAKAKNVLTRMSDWEAQFNQRWEQRRAQLVAKRRAEIEASMGLLPPPPTAPQEGAEHVRAAFPALSGSPRAGSPLRGGSPRSPPGSPLGQPMLAAAAALLLAGRGAGSPRRGDAPPAGDPAALLGGAPSPAPRQQPPSRGDLAAAAGADALAGMLLTYALPSGKDSPEGQPAEQLSSANQQAEEGGAPGRPPPQPHVVLPANPFPGTRGAVNQIAKRPLSPTRPRPGPPERRQGSPQARRAEAAERSTGMFVHGATRLGDVLHPAGTGSTAAGDGEPLLLLPAVTRAGPRGSLAPRHSLKHADPTHTAGGSDPERSQEAECPEQAAFLELLHVAPLIPATGTPVLLMKQEGGDVVEVLPPPSPTPRKLPPRGPAPLPPRPVTRQQPAREPRPVPEPDAVLGPIAPQVLASQSRPGSRAAPDGGTGGLGSTESQPAVVQPRRDPADLDPRPRPWVLRERKSSRCPAPHLKSRPASRQGPPAALARPAAEAPKHSMPLEWAIAAAAADAGAPPPGAERQARGTARAQGGARASGGPQPGKASSWGSLHKTGSCGWLPAATPETRTAADGTAVAEAAQRAAGDPMDLCAQVGLVTQRLDGAPLQQRRRESQTLLLH